jgi:hypothetical protein
MKTTATHQTLARLIQTIHNHDAANAIASAMDDLYPIALTNGDLRQPELN